MGLINGIVTALALCTFIGIAIWAFSAGRSRANLEASLLPFALSDEDGPKAGDIDE